MLLCDLILFNNMTNTLGTITWSPLKTGRTVWRKKTLLQPRNKRYTHSYWWNMKCKYEQGILLLTKFTLVISVFSASFLLSARSSKIICLCVCVRACDIVVWLSASGFCYPMSTNSRARSKSISATDVYLVFTAGVKKYFDPSRKDPKSLFLSLKFRIKRKLVILTNWE